MINLRFHQDQPTHVDEEPVPEGVLTDITFPGGAIPAVGDKVVFVYQGSRRFVVITHRVFNLDTGDTTLFSQPVS